MSIEPAEGAETFEGPVVCQVGPDGALYVGNMRDSGWGAGQNTGSIVRLRPTGNEPAGISEVRAAADGFEIRFTKPVNPRLAADPASYSLSAFRRIPTSDYGGPDVDRHSVRVQRRVVCQHNHAAYGCRRRVNKIYVLHLDLAVHKISLTTAQLDRVYRRVGYSLRLELTMLKQIVGCRVGWDYE